MRTLISYSATVNCLPLIVVGDFSFFSVSRSSVSSLDSLLLVSGKTDPPPPEGPAMLSSEEESAMMIDDDSAKMKTIFSVNHLQFYTIDNCKI